MDVVVTGVAGFIGSHLATRLLAEGHRVVGLDCLTGYAGVDRKRDNLLRLGEHPAFRLIQADLSTADSTEALEGAQVVFHLAGQPGVRSSWNVGFSDYCTNNVLATQRLLESARQARVAKLVYASSSSVYGNHATYPVDEAALPRPHSPYGVTKLAAEHLCSLYADNHGLPTVSLRYFTVYGPGQRPDMGIYRLIDAALSGQPFPLFGTGQQIRDFTFVDDVVEANLAAARAEVAPGTVVNVAGGSSVNMLEVADAVGAAVGHPIKLEHEDSMPGDVERTGGSTGKAERLLGWRPAVDLEEGIRRQVAWQRAARPPAS
jgi:UDP-glucuronate 4-epimerase